MSGAQCPSCKSFVYAGAQKCPMCQHALTWPDESTQVTALETVVREYKGDPDSIQHQFQTDLIGMHAQGYEVVDQSTMTVTYKRPAAS